MTSLTTIYADTTHTAWTRALLKAAPDTDGSYSQTLLRLTLALVLWPHGAQHLLGWFGGFGFAGTMGWMTGTLGIPAPLAAAGILLEFFGPIALVAGIASRFVGLSLGVFMATAAATHIPHGFFMNWFGTMPAGAEGFEFHLLVVAIALAIALKGAGALSLDRLLTRNASAADGRR